MPAAEVKTSTAGCHDAALIHACTRYLELERVMNDPLHPDHAKDCDEMSEYPEYLSMEERVMGGDPQTPEGMSALALVTLLSEDINDTAWDSNPAMRLARKLLEKLAGPALMPALVAQQAEAARRQAIITARYRMKGAQA